MIEPITMEEYDIKKWGKTAGNQNTANFLHWLAQHPKLENLKENASLQLGAMLQGEDWGIPKGTDAQMVTWKTIMAANPTLPKEDALKLEGAYLYPERYQKFGTPPGYLKAHEQSHWLDTLTSLAIDKPATGIGNKGFQPTVRTRGNDMGTTPAQIENWLLNYPPERRPEERKAHLAGMEAIGAYK